MFKSTVEYGVLISILETDRNEIFSMGKEFSLFFLTVFLLLLFISIKAAKELNTIKISFIQVCLIPIVLLSGFYLVKSKFFKINLTMGDLIPMTSHHLPLVVNNFIFAKYYFTEQSKIKNYAELTRSAPEGILLEEKETPDKIFLIIGESSSKSHYSLYNYKDLTTPILDSLYKNNQIAFLNNAISCAPATIFALKVVFTYTTPKNNKEFQKHKNLVEMAKDAGYTTYWFSNNGVMGEFMGTNTMISMFAKTSDYVYMSVDIRKEDLNLVNKASSYIKKGEKQFFVIHLQGNHMAYRDRYDNEDKSLISNNSQYLDYDRSIHHTDRVLGEFHNLMKKQNEKSVFIYLSDHAELVNKGHCFFNYGTDQYEIPFIYATDNYDKGKVERLISKYTNEMELFNSANTKLVLSEIIGYQISPEVVEKYNNDALYILNADNKAYLYSDIQKLPNY